MTSYDYDVIRALCVVIILVLRHKCATGWSDHQINVTLKSQYHFCCPFRIFSLNMISFKGIGEHTYWLRQFVFHVFFVLDLFRQHIEIE